MKIQDVVIDPGVHIDVLRIPAGGISKVNVVERGRKIREITVDIIQLGRPLRQRQGQAVRVEEIGRLRRHVGQIRGNQRDAPIRPVDAQQVTARHGGWRGV